MRVLGLVYVLYVISAKVNGFFHRSNLVLGLSTKRYSTAKSLHVPLHTEQAEADQPYARSLKDQLVVAGNTASTLRNLIHFGDEWSRSCTAATEGDSSQHHSLTQSQYERVTGCTSTVEIKTSVASTSEQDSSEERAIVIEGRADSRVTQGMLAVLCKIFNSLTLGKALAIDPTSLTTFFGFDSILPTGRQNTFFNMIKLIQSQLQRLSVSASTASDTASLTEEGASACAVAFTEPTATLDHARIGQGDNGITLDPSKQGPSRTLHSDLRGDNMADRAVSPAERVLDGTPSVPVVQQQQQQQQQEEVQVQDPRSGEVALLLSGGVDSSVALQLLLEQGHRVRAYYLKIWLEDELAHLNSCPWEEDLRYAQAVCDQLGVPLETVSLQKEYWRDVVQYTLAEAQRGRTPNPDVMCNSRVKFGTFYDYVGRYHAKIASGHYAQVRPAQPRLHLASEARGDTPTESDTTAAATAEEVELVCSPDPVKDQSYFLCGLSQQQLQRCLFPIGHLQKSDVRALAEKYDLPTKRRKDSQGICFLGKLKFDDFIEHYLGRSPGPVRCMRTGALLGTHNGLWFHTIGQRKGLGPLLNPGTVHAGPWFVCAKDVQRNTLFVSNETHAPEATHEPAQGYLIEQVNWINGVPNALRESATEKSREANASAGLQMRFKLRHSPHIVSGTLHLVDQRQGEDRHDASVGEHSQSHSRPTSVRVVLSEEPASVAPGQFVAFYLHDVCVGSGVVADIPIALDVAQRVDAEIVREAAAVAAPGGKRRRPRAVNPIVHAEKAPVDAVRELVKGL